MGGFLERVASLLPVDATDLFGTESERNLPARCSRPVRWASKRRASGDGAQCKNDRDSTTEGAVRAGCSTVGRVTGEAGTHALSAE
jgi:hypothetical protein